MPILNRDGAEIYFENWGEMPPEKAWVTLVNGHTRTLTDFRAMARQLTQRGWNVLSFDNRGSGKTQNPTPFTLDTIAQDVQALWEHLKIPSSHLLGISMGGAVCLRVAAADPTRLKSLILVSTAAAMGSFADEPATRDPAIWETHLQRYFSPGFLAKHRVLVQALSKETAKAFYEPGRLERAQAQRAALRDFDGRAELGKIHVPTLVIHGDEDPIIPLSAARELSEKIPGATLKVFPHSGHLLLAEMPQPLYDTVSRFLTSVS